MPGFVRETAEGVVLTLRVQTKASRDEVVGRHGDALKVRITEAPLEGKANKHLIRFLSKRLGIPRSQMTIQSGATSRTKCIAIRGVTAARVRERLG
jgi:hypothetical protein